MFVLATMAMVACEKENPNAGKLQLVAEGMGGNTKMAINGNSSYWVNGESVNINGSDYTITANSGSAYVDEDVTVTTPYLGVYPASILSSTNGLNYTLTLPAEYTYATTTYNSQTMQNLASPMVAYANGGNQLYFKHVTAAVNVQVINYHYDYDIVVDSIEVSSNNYKLNGSVVINMENVAANDFVDAQSGSTDAEKKVKMKFGSGLLVASGNSTMVQVPVLPVAADNKFTVKIAVHRADQASVTAILSRTQTTGGALARAYAGYALYTFGGPFSISDSKKAIFSKGNLQYNANSNTFSFASTQYAYIGSALGNTADTNTRKNQSALIDLFGWATSGHNNLYAYYRYPMLETTTTANNALFGDGTKGDLDANYDWGRKNDIGSFSAGYWRTFLRSEFEYIINTRTQSTVNLPSGSNNTAARYTKATVGTTCGVILFPDYYTHPNDVSVSGTPGYNTANKAYNTFAVSTSDWNKMELAGAIFLPAAGYGKNYSESTPGVSLGVSSPNSYGNYWTATGYSTTASYYITLSSSSFSATTTSKSFAKSVRLIHEMN